MQQPDSEISSPGVTSTPTSTLTPDSGPGVAYGKAFVTSLREHGVSGAGVLRPLIDDLNARTAMSPFDKATAARVACKRSTPNWGAGPWLPCRTAISSSRREWSPKRGRC